MRRNARVLFALRRLLALDAMDSVMEAFRGIFAHLSDSEREVVGEVLDTPSTKRTWESYINWQARRYEMDADEMAQDVATAIWTDGAHGARFNSSEKKRAQGFMYNVLKFKCMAVGNAFKRTRERYVPLTERGFEPEAAPLDEVSSAVLDELLDELVAYVKSTVRDDISMEIFTTWWKNVSSRGVDYVNMKKDVYVPLTRKTGISMSGLAARWKEIQRVMVGFFRNKLGVRVTDETMRRLHLSSLDAGCYFDAVSRWVLGSA